MSTVNYIYVSTSADTVTWADVKSRVLAVGVALLFVYLVTIFIIHRFTFQCKLMLLSLKNKKESRMLSKSCSKLLKLCIGMELQVYKIFKHRFIFNFST